MQVEIKKQFLIPDDGPIRFGETITDSGGRGIIGYIEWTNMPEARPGIYTAKLDIVGRMYEILVLEEYRTSELKIGEDLFAELVYRLRSLGCVDFIIIGAIDFALPFYHHIIDSLIKAGDVESYTVIEGEGRNTVDNHDLRITFTPEDVFLPG